MTSHLDIRQLAGRASHFLLAATSALLIASTTTADAQDYPQRGRPITMLVSFAAGGPTDTAARLLGPFLEKELGTSVVVVNKPGASQMIAVTELVRAKPDGYTIAMVQPPGVMVTYIDDKKKPPYTRADILPVAHFSSEANTFVVKSSSPFKTLQDWIDAAKAKPGTVKVGTSGLLGTAHLAGVALEIASGARFLFAHYNGAGPQTAALMSGEVDVSITGILIRPNIDSGEWRLLATSDNKTTPGFPGSKTLIESGYNVYSPISTGLIAPVGTPSPIVARLSGAVEKILASSEFKTALGGLPFGLDYKDSAAFAKFWDETEPRIKAAFTKAQSN